MRYQLLRLQKSNSTKAERRVGEILKRNRIAFKAKCRIGRFEIDFIIGHVALEIDGSVHRQTNSQKDTFLVTQGYVPLHIITKGLDVSTIEQEIIYLIKANNYGRLTKSKKFVRMD